MKRLLFAVVPMLLFSELFAASGGAVASKLSFSPKGTSALANVMPTATRPSVPKIGSAPKGGLAANASISYIGAPQAAAAAAGKADARVRRALQVEDVKFTEDDDGDFRVQWTLDGGRKQTTFINSNVSDCGGMELREVWSVGFFAPSIDANNLQALLEMNAMYKLGAWELQKKPDGNYWAVFSVKVSADATGDALKLISNLVAKTADDIESKATHEDKL